MAARAARRFEHIGSFVRQRIYRSQIEAVSQTFSFDELPFVMDDMMGAALSLTQDNQEDSPTPTSSFDAESFEIVSDLVSSLPKVDNEASVQQFLNNIARSWDSIPRRRGKIGARVKESSSTNAKFEHPPHVGLLDQLRPNFHCNRYCPDETKVSTCRLHRSTRVAYRHSVS